MSQDRYKELCVAYVETFFLFPGTPSVDERCTLIERHLQWWESLPGKTPEEKRQSARQRIEESQREAFSG
jgi:hypothetical protein